ncbi:uncharacterized protein LOC120346606 [Styela clava]
MLRRVCFVIFVLIVLTSHFGECEENVESDTFYEVDINDVDDQWPIRFGVKFWDWGPKRYKKIIKSLGPVFNTGHWPTLWEVSSSAPAPWEADDERMDMWVKSIYRNLQDKKTTMRETSEIHRNASIQVIGKFLGVPEAYSLAYQQKEYRAKKKAEEEGKEYDESVYYYNTLDWDRRDDLAKFFASSVNISTSFGTSLPYIEMIDRPAIASKEELYVAPEQYTYLVKKTREELDARGLTEDKVKIMCPGVDYPGQLRPYLKKLAEDKEAYDKLHAITTHIPDNGGSLLDVQHMAEKLRDDIQNILPADWEPKRVVVTEFFYNGTNDIEVDGMRFNGNIYKCYDDKYQRTGHMILKDCLAQTPWYAVRMLAGLTIQLSHGLPWVVYNQGADQWWERTCDGLIDRDERPKQILAAFESLLPYLTNETYPIRKQWKNTDDCYISAFKSVKSKLRVVVAVTNFSPKVCERSFSLRGIDLWDIQKYFHITARIVTYNNGTVSITANKPYRALLTEKLLNYDVYDVEDGVKTGPEIEFDLTVGPYASATAIIDAKAPKRKKSTIFNTK